MCFVCYIHCLGGSPFSKMCFVLNLLCYFRCFTDSFNLVERVNNLLFIYKSYMIIKFYKVGMQCLGLFEEYLTPLQKHICFLHSGYKYLICLFYSVTHVIFSCIISLRYANWSCRCWDIGRSSCSLSTSRYLEKIRRKLATALLIVDPAACM